MRSRRVVARCEDGLQGRWSAVQRSEVRHGSVSAPWSLARVGALPVSDPVFAGLHHVQLAIPPEGEPRARAFYAGVLGMTELEKPPVLAARGGCWFRGGGWEVHLGVEQPFVPARKAHPGVLVRSLDALADRLEASGTAVQWDDAFPGHRRFYSVDPHGNRLEFLEPHGAPAEGPGADALVGGERAVLEGMLDAQRAEVAGLLLGLDEAGARTRLVPSLTTPLSLVKHATFVERVWFHARVARVPREELGLPAEAEDSWLLDPLDTVDAVHEAFLAACSRSRAVAAAHDLDEQFPWHRGPVSLRFVYAHVVAELARHAGHGDILREQLAAQA